MDYVKEDPLRYTTDDPSGEPPRAGMEAFLHLSAQMGAAGLFIAIAGAEGV
jgi:hypothetical protein